LVASTCKLDAQRAGQKISGDRQREYRFSDAYGFGLLNVAAVTRLARAFRSDVSTRALYTRFYPVGAKPQFDDTTTDIHRCALLNLTAGELDRCLQSNSVDPS